MCPHHFVLNFAYYFNPAIFKDVDNENVYEKVTNNLGRENVYALNTIDNLDLSKTEKVLYLDAAAQFSFPDNNILATLSQNFQLKDTCRYYEVFTIYQFVKKNK